MLELQLFLLLWYCHVVDGVLAGCHLPAGLLGFLELVLGLSGLVSSGILAIVV